MFLANSKEAIKNQIEFQNRRLRNQLDGVFIRKKTFEEGLADLKKKEEELEALAKIKIKELGENGKEEYSRLEKDIGRLGDLVHTKKSELREISFQW